VARTSSVTWVVSVPRPCRDEVLTDLKRYRQGFRVKHRYQGNWIKLYDQCAQVLRIEVVINHPASFRVRRWSSRPGQRVLGCFPLLKSVAFLDR
jgi:hypothetical protein